MHQRLSVSWSNGGYGNIVYNCDVSASQTMVVMMIKAKLLDKATLAFASLACALLIGLCAAAYASAASEPDGEGEDAQIGAVTDPSGEQDGESGQDAAAGDGAAEGWVPETDQIPETDQAPETDQDPDSQGSADPNPPVVNPEDDAESATVIAGETQFDTSAAQALKAFPDGCSTVIVASGTAPIDALAASSLAGALDCPILLTSKSKLPQSASEAIGALGCTHAIIVGGEAVVAKKVESALSSAMGGKGSVERLAGTSQYDTQLEIFKYGRTNGFWDGVDTVIAVSGMPQSMADGLSVSPAAYKLKAPVFLVDSKGNLDPQAIKVLADDPSFKRAVLVGGTAVVSDVTFGFFQGVTMCYDGSPEVVRLAGKTLYDTSASVARWSVKQGILSWADAAFATGRSPYDALGGGVLQGKSGSVMLLIDSGYTAALDAAVKAGPDAVKHVRFFGGDAIMPKSLRTMIIDRLGIEPGSGKDSATPSEKPGKIGSEELGVQEDSSSGTVPPISDGQAAQPEQQPEQGEQGDQSQTDPSSEDDKASSAEVVAPEKGGDAA